VGPVDTGNGITVAVLRITTGPVFEAAGGVLIACCTGAEGSEISPAAVETADGSAVSVCRSLEIILKGQRQKHTTVEVTVTVTGTQAPPLASPVTAETPEGAEPPEPPLAAAEGGITVTYLVDVEVVVRVVVELLEAATSPSAVLIDPAPPSPPAPPLPPGRVA
jgi:hypothetical protein